MDVEYRISKADRAFGPMASFGPTPPRKHPQLQVPEQSYWEVTYEALDLKVSLDIYFTGERLEIQRLVVEGLKRRPVQTRDLTQLALPKVLCDIAALMIPGFEYWTREFQDKNLEWESLKVDDEYLTQMILLHQVMQGNARKAIMDYFGMPRSTATLLIKRLKDSKSWLPLEP
jgi:hypothetical protein